MRVRTVGDGTPELALVACLHGDERCGETAVERVLAEKPALKRSVRFVVANEEAIAANDRYVDEDLNRAFPGDPTERRTKPDSRRHSCRNCATAPFSTSIRRVRIPTRSRWSRD